MASNLIITIVVENNYQSLTSDLAAAAWTDRRLSIDRKVTGLSPP